MNSDQQQRFERQAVLEAHATLFVRLCQSDAEATYLHAQLVRVHDALEALLALPRPVQKAA